MNHIERFIATIERRPVDRLASWLGLPDIKAYKGLFDYFDVKSVDELKEKINDDVYTVELPYNSPTSNAIYAAFNFGKESHVNINDRTLTQPGFFENYEDPGRVDDFAWPDPEKYISKQECKRIVEAAPN